MAKTNRRRYPHFTPRISLLPSPSVPHRAPSLNGRAILPSSNGAIRRRPMPNVPQSPGRQSVSADHHAARVAETVSIGKIVRSESHVRYTCQVFGPGETVAPPEPADFAFGSFVRLPLRSAASVPDVARLVGRDPWPDAHLAAPVDALMSPAPANSPLKSGHFAHASAAPPRLAGEGAGGRGSAFAIGLIYDT